MSAAWTPEQRAMAAADLCERAAKMFRADPMTRHGETIARWASYLGCDGPELTGHEYRHAMKLAGVNTEDIDAAVAAILAGQHPPSSLPGKVVEHIADAARVASIVPTQASRADGQRLALCAVLGWIGAKP